MMRFDRITLGRQAKELGFVRDTFEKVCRLADGKRFYPEYDSVKALAQKSGRSFQEIYELVRREAENQ